MRRRSPARTWPFFAGNALSAIGTWFQLIAQSILVYELTGSVTLVGVVNFAQSAATLVLGPVAGVAADRRDRRGLLVRSQLLSAGLIFALAIADAVDAASVPLVVGVALGVGACNTYAFPIVLAMAPQAATPGREDGAVNKTIMTFSLARAIGPVLGAVVVRWLGTPSAFALNGLSYLALAAGALAVPRVELLSFADTTDTSFRTSLRRLSQDRLLVAMIVAAGTLSMAIDPVATLSPAIAVDVLGRDAALSGTMLGAFGFGALLGGAVLARFAPISDQWLLASLLGAASFVMAYATSASFMAILVLLVLAGIGFIVAMTTLMSRLQRAVPASEHGRLMAVWSVAVAWRTVASLVDGAVADGIGFAAGAAVVVAPAVAASLFLRSALRGRRVVLAGGRRS
ncbi:MAG: MFS transporter [Actinomycetota bacterium]|nr:MFS transporter [Actinomycetota bacterium]